MDHRAGDLGAPTALNDHRDDLVFPAQPGNPVTTHHEAVGQRQLVVDESVSERGVIGMDVDGGVGEVSVIPVPLADRVRLPSATVARPTAGRGSLNSMTSTPFRRAAGGSQANGRRLREGRSLHTSSTKPLVQGAHHVYRLNRTAINLAAVCEDILVH